MAGRSTPKGWLKLALGFGVAVLLVSTVLPWLAENGYAGHVIQENARTDRDASALFYTEDDRTWEVLDRISTLEAVRDE
ncbi:MAG: hypothetical protein L3K26_02235 [Candidatus Hydrogenedentes bacterium]|nr:hypothetical protein [Candidatus Hydrogenedentota bacterium]